MDGMAEMVVSTSSSLKGMISCQDRGPILQGIYGRYGKQMLIPTRIHWKTSEGN
jgi:hypothetical protein